MAYKTIHTAYGLQRMAQAEAAGIAINLTHMAVGDGNGNEVSPVDEQTQLVGEKFRAIVNRVFQDPTTPTKFTAELIVPATEGGFTMREVGIFDEDGALFAVGNLPATYKPTISEGAYADTAIRLEFLVTNASAVTIQVDPNVVLVTRTWVANNVTAGTLIPGGTTNQLLAKQTNADGDFKWVDLDGINVTVDSIEEKQTLALNQTTVTMAVTNTRGLAVYIEGVRISKGAGADGWTIADGGASLTQIVLGKAYPADTSILLTQNEPTGSAPAPLERSQNLADLENKATARANLGVYSKTEADQKAPVSMVAYFPLSTAPAGWLKANGAAVSRTAYADLYSKIGTAFGVGDGFNTFNLPDFRGEFLRSWDDGRGVDAGRAIGSAQGDAIRNISGRISGGGGAYFDSATGPFYLPPTYDALGTQMSGETGRTDDIGFNASLTVPTANENRPRNIALLACIKF